MGLVTRVLDGFNCSVTGCIRFFGTEGYCELTEGSTFTNIRTEPCCSAKHQREAMYIQRPPEGLRWACTVGNGVHRVRPDAGARPGIRPHSLHDALPRGCEPARFGHLHSSSRDPRHGDDGCLLDPCATGREPGSHSRPPSGLARNLWRAEEISVRPTRQRNWSINSLTGVSGRVLCESGLWCNSAARVRGETCGGQRDVRRVRLAIVA